MTPAVLAMIAVAEKSFRHWVGELRATAASIPMRRELHAAQSRQVRRTVARPQPCSPRRVDSSAIELPGSCAAAGARLVAMDCASSSSDSPRRCRRHSRMRRHSRPKAQRSRLRVDAPRSIGDAVDETRPRSWRPTLPLRRSAIETTSLEPSKRRRSTIADHGSSDIADSPDESADARNATPFGAAH